LRNVKEGMHKALREAIGGVRQRRGKRGSSREKRLQTSEAFRVRRADAASAKRTLSSLNVKRPKASDVGEETERKTHQKLLVPPRALEGKSLSDAQPRGQKLRHGGTNIVISEKAESEECQLIIVRIRKKPVSGNRVTLRIERPYASGRISLKERER